MKNKGFTAFCMKAIIVLALVVVVDKAVGMAFVKMKDVGLQTNPESIWLKTPYVVEKVDADVIIIGSSRATHHYVPSILSDSLDASVYNCGQDGCFFLYQNCLINMVLDRYKPKTIIWDLQPECFNHQGTSREYQNVRYLSPYYGNSKWATSFINSEDKMSAIKMRSQMFAFNSKLLNSMFPLVMNGSTTEKGYIPIPSEGYEYPKLSEDFVDNSSYEVWQENLYLYATTIERCRDEGVKLLLLVSPSFTQVSKAYSKAIFDLNRVAIEHNNKVHDYGALYLDDATKFKDFSHMNKKGAESYTIYLIAEGILVYDE